MYDTAATRAEILVKGDPDSDIYPATPALLRVATNIQTLKIYETIDVIPDIFYYMQAMETPATLETLYFYHEASSPRGFLKVEKAERHDHLHTIGNMATLKIDIQYYNGHEWKRTGDFGTYLSGFNDLLSLLRQCWPAFHLLPVLTWTFNVYTHPRPRLEEKHGIKKIRVECEDGGGKRFGVTTDLIARSGDPTGDASVSSKEEMNSPMITADRGGLSGEQTFVRDIVLFLAPTWATLNRVSMSIAVDADASDAADDILRAEGTNERWSSFARTINGGLAGSAHNLVGLGLEVRVMRFDKSRQKRPSWETDQVLYKDDYRL